jgi:hypothetical protein
LGSPQPSAPSPVLVWVPAGPDNDNSSTGRVGLSSAVSLLICVLTTLRVVWWRRNGSP